MKVIIAGAGEVGFHLASLLAHEAQDTTLIDTSTSQLEYAENHLDVFPVLGDATSYKTLLQANVRDADLLVAVTSSQDTNLATAIIGKQLGAKRTVARIKNTEFLTDKQTLDLKSVGIDELISPESLAAREIVRILDVSACTDTFDFGKGKLSIIGLIVGEKAPILHKTLSEVAALNPDHTFITVAIHRDGETIIPYGKTRFQAHDHVYFTTTNDGIKQVLDIAGKRPVKIRDVMIVGGSTTGYHLARRLAGQYKVKLIERDRDKAFRLADQLPDTLVIHGDGTNVELLEEEGIDQMDAFITLTGNVDTNIVTSLVAKSHGVRKTISMVEKIEYIDVSHRIGIDSMINKKLIAANFIFRYIRKGEVLSLMSIPGVDAEILEFRVATDSPIAGRKIRNLHFPKEAIIGGLIRDGQGIITLGNTRIEPDDRVVVVTKGKEVGTVEKFFECG